jgi:phosphocarrier protein
MQQAKLMITTDVGLHARPATLFVRTSNQFESDIQIIYGSKEANAKSILQVLSLGVEKDGEIDLIINGPDENQALNELSSLVQTNFSDVH